MGVVGEGPFPAWVEGAFDLFFHIVRVVFLGPKIVVTGANAGVRIPVSRAVHAGTALASRAETLILNTGRGLNRAEKWLQVIAGTLGELAEANWRAAGDTLLRKRDGVLERRKIRAEPSSEERGGVNSNYYSELGMGQGIPGDAPVRTVHVFDTNSSPRI